MKRYHNGAFMLVISAVLLFPGCLEENVHTTISSDGSSERTISMSLPERRLPEQAFPGPADPTWTAEWKETGDEDTNSRYQYVAKKYFPTPGDLDREYAGLFDSTRPGLSVSVKKRFEWFFTYIEYDERYSYPNPFRNVPVSDYLSRDEIERFQMGEKSDSLKRRVERWKLRDVIEEFYRSIVAEARRRNDPDLPASLLLGNKEECIARIEGHDISHAGASDTAAGPRRGNTDAAREAMNVIAKVTDTPAALKLIPFAGQVIAGIDRKESQIQHPDQWSYSVQMPGLIIGTNSTAVDGNTITWKFEPDQVRVADYLMHATSRVTNVWAFITTGVVALVLIIVIFISFRRRRMI